MMVEIVIGEKRNPLAADALITQLSQSDYRGTLYLGYPIIASLDETVFIDALLTTEEHGVVVFDFDGHLAPHHTIRAIKERQDELYNAVHQKLISYKPLRVGRQLEIDVHVITLAPELEDRRANDIRIVSHSDILRELESLPGISSEQLRKVNAAMQRVTTIKPPQRRASVQRPTSRGGVLKRIEAEIANLDQWQKRAAIETPDGPQRIRGLAGSGKTIVLALKAAYLHARDQSSRILVTFQTRSLYQQFRDLIRRFTFEHLRDEPDWNRLRILHAWGSRSDPGVYSELCVANGVKPHDFLYGRSNFGRDRAFGGVCEELLEALKGKEIEPLFDSVLIDEAQDFPQAFFELAYLATADPKRIIYAYDELQNLGVYSMAPPSELFGLDENGTPRVSELRNDPRSPQQDIVLPVCYRNTPWALTTAHALGFGIYRDEGLVQFFDDPRLWRDIGYDVVSGQMTPGRHVQLKRSPQSAPRYFAENLDSAEAVLCRAFDSEEDQADWVASSIARNLKEDELEYRDILVIISNPITASKRAALIVRRLEDLGIPAHVAGVTMSRDVLFDDESIAISSIYRAKGNEAPMVYLVDSDYCYSGFELIKRRNILFTAITRSRAWVRLAGVGDQMKRLAAEVREVVGNNYALGFDVPTATQLENMRRIHRDMTREERANVEKMEQTLETFAELTARGDLSLEQLPPALRDKLRSLFRGGA